VNPSFSPTANPLLSLPLISGKAVEDATYHIEPADLNRLTRLLAQGDEDSFREFHARYFLRLYKFLLVITHGQEQQAEDALQETMLRVIRYARAFDSEEVFWSWLKVLARSAARDAGRKQQRYFALLQCFALRLRLYLAEPSHGEENTLSAALEESLCELPKADRALLEAKYIAGHTLKELSQQTALTEKAVESRLLRLRRDVHERVLHKLRSI
jgi:RNA polymerase sigma-70 factor (ECF subfamily)